jgi:hypothetical protein
MVVSTEGMYPEGFREFFESQRRMQEAMRRALVDSGFLENQRRMQEAMRQALRGSGALDSIRASQEHMRQLVQTASFQSSLRTIRESIAAAQQAWNSEAVASIAGVIERLNAEQRDAIARSMEAIDIGLAVDAEAAIGEVLGPAADDLDLQLPDGLLALPLMVARLPTSQRLALVLRLVALILATWFYMDALADERLEVEHVTAALLTNFWLYSALLGAIERAEDELVGERKADAPDPP